MMRVHCRWGIRRDRREIESIERASSPSPWTDEEYGRTVRLKNVISMVAEAGERVVGYMVYELGPQHIEVMKLAVDPSWRRLGVGSQMADKLASKLSAHRRTRLTLRVRAANLDGQLFLRSRGFLAVGVDRGWYEDADEDAYRFEYEYRPAAGEPECAGRSVEFVADDAGSN